MKLLSAIGVTMVGLLLVAGWRRESRLAETLRIENRRLADELNQFVHVKAQSGTETPTQSIEENYELPRERKEPVKEPLGESETNPKTDTNISILPILTTPVAAENTTNQSAQGAEPLPYTEAQLKIYRCSNQMFQINLATERWAADHNGLIPEDLADLRDYLAPMILVCPEAQPASLAASWNAFDTKNITYQIYAGAKGARWDFSLPGFGSSPQTIHYLRCPIHKSATLNRVMPSGIPSSKMVH